MICQNCKNTIPEGSGFCPYCGAKTAAPVITEKPKRNAQPLIKIIITVLLAAVLCCLAFVVRSSSAKKLDGTWVEYEAYESDDMADNLSAMAFYDDEIAYADTEACDSVYCVTFDAKNKTYTLGYDEDLSRECARAYLDDFFTTLYENRADIESYGGEADGCASAEEFKEWYAATLFAGSFGDYAEMLDSMADSMIGWYEMPTESGTFAATATRIVFTADDSDGEKAQADYTLKDGILTIEFSNSTDTFTKY